MDAETHHQFNRVAVKLYKLFLDGVSFEPPCFWIYDWNSSLGTPENLKSVAAEDKVLTALTVAGVIKVGSRNNPFYQTQSPYPQAPYTGYIVPGGFEAHDAQFREYNGMRYVEAFHYDRFIQVCKEQGINYKEAGIAATLKIADQRPIVRAGDKTYTLKTLQDGSPLDVIEQANAHPGEQITFVKLRSWMGKPNAFMSQNNFRQIFRKNEFGAGNILHPFADIATDTFTLKHRATLTPAELSAIQNASTD